MEHGAWGMGHGDPVKPLSLTKSLLGYFRVRMLDSGMLG